MGRILRRQPTPDQMEQTIKRLKTEIERLKASSMNTWRDAYAKERKARRKAQDEVERLRERLADAHGRHGGEGEPACPCVDCKQATPYL